MTTDQQQDAPSGSIGETLAYALCLLFIFALLSAPLVLIGIAMERNKITEQEFKSDILASGFTLADPNAMPVAEERPAPGKPNRAYALVMDVVVGGCMLTLEVDPYARSRHDHLTQYRNGANVEFYKIIAAQNTAGETITFSGRGKPAPYSPTPEQAERYMQGDGRLYSECAADTTP